jgi:hypothetical protein
MPDSQEFVIDIPVTVKDQTNPGAANAEETIDSLQASIDGLKNGVKGLNDSVKQVEKVKSSTDKLKAGAVSLGTKGHEVFTNLGNSIKNGFLKGLNLLVSPLNFLKKSIFSLGGLIGIGTSWWAFIMSPLKMADNTAKARMGLEAWTTSTAKAKKMMEAFNQMSFKGTTTTDEWAQLAIQPLQNKWDENKLANTMQILGDMSAASRKGTQGTSNIIKYLNNAKRMGSFKNVEQMSIRYGIPMAEYMREGLGMSKDEFKKALKNNKISMAQGINAMLGTSEKKNKGQMEKEAEGTYSGMVTKTKNFINEKVISPWGEGIRVGLIDVLKDLNKAMFGNESRITSWGEKLQKISHGAVKALGDNLKGLITKFNKITDTKEFKTADLSGKFKILWEDIVAKPLANWWSSGGETKITAFGSKLGKVFMDTAGSVIKTGWNTFWSNLIPTMAENLAHMNDLYGRANENKRRMEKGLPLLPSDPRKDPATKLGDVNNPLAKPNNKSVIQRQLESLPNKQGYITQKGKLEDINNEIAKSNTEINKRMANLSGGNYIESGTVISMDKLAKDLEDKTKRSIKEGLEKGLDPSIVDMNSFFDKLKQGTRNALLGSSYSTKGEQIFGLPTNPLMPTNNIPAMASGGIVKKPTISLIGESGPEAIIPLGKKTGSFGNISVNLNPVINITSSAKADDVLRVIEEAKGKIFDDAANHIANKLSEIYSNMPVAI